MFENIKKAWKEARGTRLEQELSDTFTRLQGADPKLYAEIHKHLQPLYSKVKPKLFNMTPEGQIKAGKAFQDEARRKLDFDVGQGYALWIIGAWLESGHLPGAAAEKVHSFLDNFLSEMLAKFPEPIGQQESSDASQSEKLTFMDMLVMQISMQVGMGGVELDDLPSLAKQDDFVLGYLVGAADAVSRAEGARPGHPTNYCLISLDNHVPVHVGSRSLSSWATLARTLSRCKTRRTTIALPGVFAAPGCGAWMSTQARTIRTASNG